MAVNLYRNAPRIVMLAVAGGFAFLLIELFMLNHAQGGKLPGAIAAGVGTLLGLLGLANVGGLRKILPVLFLVLALSGLYGAFVHSGARDFRAQGAANVPATEDRTVNRAIRSFTLFPPTLGPLMLTGLSLLGAAGALMSVGAEAVVSDRRTSAAMA
jgi:hypothetical protein